METSLRRLYVGGIGPSVTDAELSERFGRFGKVDAVDIISRKDDQGNPIKTFAYLNINISDADLKKCLSLLNKTKWKGGVLQIEIAKESFLHRLAQERQEAKEKEKSKQQSHSQNDLLQSLEKAGVSDFQMKAAVPGTEVPNHKDWVVSKYGRVLPVLHLKGNKQSKIMKYDPSKYCHNLKKLDSVSLDLTPVSQLTWHLDGGDDDMSKKRRGEFPEYKSPVKKRKVNSYLNTSKNDEKEKSLRTPQTTMKKAIDPLEARHKRENFQVKSQGYMGNKSINSMSDDEYDSEEELKAIIAREKMVKESGKHAEDDTIEVVDDSFTPRYKTHWAEEIGSHRSFNGGTRDDNEYDSADTDEIITVSKSTQNCNNNQNKMSKKSNEISTNLNVSKYSVKCEDEEDRRTEEERQSNDSDTEDSSDSYSDEEYKSMMQNCYRLDLSMGDLEALAKEAGDSDEEDSGAENESQSNDADTEDCSDSYSDEEYESMMQNCYRLDLSMGDLEALAKKASESNNTGNNNDSDQEYDSADTDDVIAEAKSVQPHTVGEIKGSNDDQTSKEKQKSKYALTRDIEPGNCSNEKISENNSSHSESEIGSIKKLKSLKSVSKSTSDDDGEDDTSEDEKAATKTNKVAKNNDDNACVFGNRKRKKGIEPDDIVASILAENDDDSSNDEQKQKKKINPSNLPPAFKGLGSLRSSLSVSDETKAILSSKSCEQLATSVNLGTKIKGDGSSSESKIKQDSKNNDGKPSTSVKKTPANVKQRSEKDSSSSSDESSNDDESSSPVDKPNTSQKSSSKDNTISKARQLQDNQKRLAAMEERRKEREQQKQAIQGALLKPDSQSAKKSQHIVFDSESEEESEKEEEASTSNVQSDNKATHVKAKLFDSSGEDSDDEDEKDATRFEIKTQYEGRSGEKLMQLQSRFGTDERFRMDARFLEDNSGDEEDSEEMQKLQAGDEEDDDLSAEKKKNLDILQSVLNINVEPQPTGKKSAKAKKFKDLNALQYDPTKEDHALFETKAAEEKKESKSEMKKKRLEAEKLPEVSKEIFHEVIVDFKEVFGASKPNATEEPEMTWDQVEKPQQMEVESSVSDVDFSFQKKEEPAGFTFSFFGASTEKSIPLDEPYKTETIKGAKVAWQEDPRFQDSSSEGEEEEADTTVNASSQLQRSSSVRFFYFVKDDTRLQEGIEMFYRSSSSVEKAKEWGEMRDTIMEECKKRYKNAKKKLKSKY